MIIVKLPSASAKPVNHERNSDDTCFNFSILCRGNAGNLNELVKLTKLGRQIKAIYSLLINNS